MGVQEVAQGLALGVAKGLALGVVQLRVHQDAEGAARGHVRVFSCIINFIPLVTLAFALSCSPNSEQTVPVQADRRIRIIGISSSRVFPKQHTLLNQNAKLIYLAMKKAFKSYYMWLFFVTVASFLSASIMSYGQNTGTGGTPTAIPPDENHLDRQVSNGNHVMLSEAIKTHEEVISLYEIPNITHHYLLFLSLGLTLIGFFLYSNSSFVYGKVFATQLRRDSIDQLENDSPKEKWWDEKTIRALIRKKAASIFGISFYSVCIGIIFLWIIWVLILRGHYVGFSISTLLALFYDLKSHPRDYTFIFLFIGFLGITLGCLKFYLSYSGKSSNNQRGKKWEKTSFGGLILGLISLVADIIAIGLFIFHR